MPRLLVALLCALSLAIPAVAAAAPPATQTQAPAQACQNRTAPPAAVDASEKPAPGQQPPAPLPVPADPVGGPRLGECGLVLPVGAPQPPANQFESWVLADLDSGRVLAARDPHARQRPASLIKILLATVVLRELKMDTQVTGTWDDANQDGTRVGIGPDGKYTNDQVLHALLMHSGNDAAHSFAVQLGGMDQAVAKMNALAHSSGALDTRTASPSGLDGPGMSSSAYDLALLYRIAMQDKRFADAVRTEQIQFPGWGDKPAFVVANDNPLLYNYEGDLGGKTGYTDDALHTYINAAQRGSSRIVLVGMRGTMSPVTAMYTQSKSLMDYGLALAQSAAQPVGQLVDQDPDSRVSATPTTAAAPLVAKQVTAASPVDPGPDNPLLVVLLLVGVLVLGYVVFAVLRNRSRPDKTSQNP
ncbi:D-alanyl-D-alanine carboxypeptidase family protein [Kutzneria viridogrisea]|uniref:D-alanyl-D-alanine carboxypeptidase (Penicillin-binding protein 5/6) n=1 Tax=Kutzneria viridogrisea TaxID=47990 RepID=A0ABR6BE61_9PSEU|nr:D-alanyl-D-alanine carboxypeptidase (penicillin-binding protein 5/6) [Kutzneria viridogrisea]